MNGALSFRHRLLVGLVVGVLAAAVVWFVYLSGVGNFLLTAVSGPDRGGPWLPVVRHTAVLSSGETVDCVDDGGSGQFCESSGFQKSDVLGYVPREPLFGVPMHALWSCAESPTTPAAQVRVTLTTSDCQGSRIGRYRLGYTFDNAADVPDAPPVLLTACTQGNAVRVVGNGSCADNGFGDPRVLGYVAPAGDQLQSLCEAVKEACAATNPALTPFCDATLQQHCALPTTPTTRPTNSR